MTEQRIPLLEVAEILDTTTLVVSGLGVDQLEHGERLMIVGVGPIVRNTNTPLVVPKRSVQVTMVSPAYALVRPEVTDEVIQPPSAIFESVISTKPKTVRRRAPLNVDEKGLAGNPGSAPVRVGDPVVRPTDLAAFVAMLTEARAQKNK